MEIVVSYVLWSALGFAALAYVGRSIFRDPRRAYAAAAGIVLAFVLGSIWMHLRTEGERLASATAAKRATPPGSIVAPALPGGTETVFPTTGNPPGTGPDGSRLYGASYITSDKLGNLWFTIYNDDAIGEISADGVREYPLPSSVTTRAGPFYIATNPSDGTIWFTEARVGKVGTFDPCRPGRIEEYEVTPFLEGGLALVAGSAWIALVGPNAIAQIHPPSHKVAMHVLPTQGGHPGFVAAGPDGEVWFTEQGSIRSGSISKIGALDPRNGKITEYVLPTKQAAPQQIVAGPDGNMWFAESNANKIGTIDLKTKRIVEYQVPGQTGDSRYLIHLAAGPSGSNTLWFAELVGDVGWITTSGRFGKPQFVGSMPYGLTAGRDGRMWIALAGTTGANGAFAHVTPPGIVPGSLGRPCKPPI